MITEKIKNVYNNRIKSIALFNRALTELVKELNDYDEFHVKLKVYESVIVINEMCIEYDMETSLVHFTHGDDEKAVSIIKENLSEHITSCMENGTYDEVKGNHKFDRS